MNLSANQYTPAARCADTLCEPWCYWTGEEILHHYQTRDSIQYFPIADALETERRKIDHILDNYFELNDEGHQLGPRIDWAANPSQDLEWLILLHKFYYAVGLGIAYDESEDQRYAEKWMDLVASWIDQSPPDFVAAPAMKSDAAQVAGRRVQNWVFANYYFVTVNHPACVTADFYLRFLTSLYQQVEYLCEHLSPARNHRTLELCAIFLAAIVFPEFRRAAEWREFAIRELLRNIQTDLLPDGVHCELSTDYHHLVLKNYLWVRRLAALNEIPIPVQMDQRIIKALDFSMYAHKPDGVIPAISDGDSRGFLDLLQQGYELYGREEYRYVATGGRYGTPPPACSKGFADSGYYILRSGWGDGSEPYRDERYLLFDCGPLGAGNHGHLDLLSFEMAAYGQSLIVDPGRYTYDESGDVNWRVRFRGTAYHNTVLVDGRNQTRYEAGKRRFKIKGPAPDHELRTFICDSGFDYLHGIARSHEYPVVHERKIVFVRSHYWIICDLLSASETHNYDLLFHLSPMAQDSITIGLKRQTLQICSPHLVITQAFDPNTQLRVDEGFVSRRYGVKEAAPIIKISRQAANTCFCTVLYPYKDEQPSISITALPVFGDNEPVVDTEAAALSIVVTAPGQHTNDYFFVSHENPGKEYYFDRFSVTREGRVVARHTV